MINIWLVCDIGIRAPASEMDTKIGAKFLTDGRTPRNNGAETFKRADDIVQRVNGHAAVERTRRHNNI